MSASWVNRARTDGTVSIQIKWRDRQLGRWQSETFKRPEKAAEFRSAVEASGDRWPTGWVRARGWARDLRDTMTVLQVYEDWLPHARRRVAKGKVRPATLHGYMGDFERHVVPRFGEMPFEDLTLEDLEDWVNALLTGANPSGRPLAPKSVRNFYCGAFSQVLTHGVSRLGLRPDHPGAGLELPDKPPSSKQVRFFTHEEWALLRTCLRSDVLTRCDTLLATGLRPVQVAVRNSPPKGRLARIEGASLDALAGMATRAVPLLLLNVAM